MEKGDIYARNVSGAEKTAAWLWDYTFWNRWYLNIKLICLIGQQQCTTLIVHNDTKILWNDNIQTRWTIKMTPVTLIVHNNIQII